MKFTFPKRSPGRPSLAVQAEYAELEKALCDRIVEIRSRLNFDVSSRGWCYILEEHGLKKGDFDDAQKLINHAREWGLLPLDICADDDARSFDNLEDLDEQGADEFAAEWVEYLDDAHNSYRPISFWENQKFYVEMLVEKIDLKSLFSPACRSYHVPIANARGWPDYNTRGRMATRFQYWESRGKTPVLLYCGDFDPVGLMISKSYRRMFERLARATGWSPDNLIIDRFGLNAEFIEREGLTWIENLGTSSGGAFDDPSHNQHNYTHVTEYLRQYGARKVEANALVTRPDAGRALCREAIREYINARSARAYERDLDEARESVRLEISRLMRRRSRS